MNPIDIIDDKTFLNQLFPEGLTDKMLIGQAELDVEGRFSLNLHTMQKPSKEITKWGKHGIDYDVIVITLIGSNITKLSIENWRDISYAPITLEKVDQLIRLTSSNENWAFTAEFESLGFQRCSTYFS